MFKLTFIQNDIINNINWDGMMKTVKEMGMLERIMFNTEMMVPGYIIQGVGLFLQGVAIVRMINIALLQVIAPFKLALCSKYGTRPAWEFLGRYISTVGQNVIIMIAIQIYTAIANEIILVDIQGTADFMIKIVLSSVVLVVTILSAQTFAKFLVER
jgi:predicted Na+-dependent transporter